MAEHPEWHRDLVVAPAHALVRAVSFRTPKFRSQHSSSQSMQSAELHALGAILLRHVSSILKCSERGKRCPKIHLPWLSYLSASTRLVLSACSRPARSLCENLRTPCMCAIAVSARTRGLSPLSACTRPALSLRVAFRPLWRWEGGDSPAICGEKIEVLFACL